MNGSSMSYCDALTSVAVVGVGVPNRLAACGLRCTAPAGPKRRPGDSSDSWYLPSMSLDLQSERHTMRYPKGSTRTAPSSRAREEAFLDHIMLPEDHCCKTTSHTWELGFWLLWVCDVLLAMSLPHGLSRFAHRSGACEAECRGVVPSSMKSAS